MIKFECFMANWESFDFSGWQWEFYHHYAWDHERQVIIRDIYAQRYSQSMGQHWGVILKSMMIKGVQAQYDPSISAR